MKIKQITSVFPVFSTSPFFTARVRSTREGNVLTSVCPSIHPSVCPRGGGVPISHNALQHFPECHEAAAGGVPGSGTPRGGYPAQVPPRGGTRLRYPPPGGYPGQVPPPGGYPGQVPTHPPPGGGGGTQVRYPPGGGGYPGRTTEGVLTTRRAVCLLRSRRRTFLFSGEK